jgi:DNA repair protein SbcD/Mre11
VLVVRFRFVHAADLHLDTPFEGVRPVAPFVADALREASLDAFDALVSLALAREAAFVVLAGGIYEGPERGIRAQLAFRRGLERLSRAGIATLIAQGHRDPIETGWPAIRSWPKGVTLFGSDEVTSIPIERDGEVIATVQGISDEDDGPADKLAGRFSRPDEGGFTVGVLHASVEVEELVAAGLDYWALGHSHTREILADGEPWVASPGTLQGRGFQPSERGAKGAFVVEVDGTSASEPEFLPLDRVRCAMLEADVGGLGDVMELTQMLRELAESEARTVDRRSLLLRARLVGAGPVVEHLRRPGALHEMLAGLRDVHGEKEDPFLWWEHLEDETRRPLDHEALRRRGDFPGALLDLADEVAGDESFVQRNLAAVAAPDLAQLVGDLPGPMTPERGQRAVELALDTLLTDQA